jgi:predicted DNA binding protein
MTYVYSPIPREFIIDHNTQIIGEEGAISISEFIDYSEISKVDEVYTIIAEGTRATYLVQNEYATQGVKGQIYQVNDSEIMIKDVLVYNSGTKKWTTLSLTNSYGQVNLLENSIIIKENQVVSKDELESGDKLRVMTTENLSSKLLLTSDRAVDGVIIFVEK